MPQHPFPIKSFLRKHHGVVQVLLNIILNKKKDAWICIDSAKLLGLIVTHLSPLSAENVIIHSHARLKVPRIRNWKFISNSSCSISFTISQENYFLFGFHEKRWSHYLEPNGNLNKLIEAAIKQTHTIWNCVFVFTKRNENICILTLFPHIKYIFYFNSTIKRLGVTPVESNLRINIFE